MSSRVKVDGVKEVYKSGSRPLVSKRYDQVREPAKQ